MKQNHFHPKYIKKLQKNPLTKDEILKGNRLFLRFMGYDHEKSEEWITECALYNKSWDELMNVALKIASFETEVSSEMNH